MISAFAYLIGTSFRNRLASQARRIRSPRYAFAFLAGLAYFAFLVFGRGWRSDVGINPLYGTSAEALAPMFVVLLVISGWLLSADANALAFTQAEVSMLFPAPLTRNGLIVYKLARAQIAILVSSTLMVLIFGRGSREIPHVMTALAFWVMFSTVSLHNLGAALVRARAGETGRSSDRQRRLARMVGVLITIPIVLAFMGPMLSGAQLGDSAPAGAAQRLIELLSTPAAYVLLTPFRIVAAPTFAHTEGEWLLAFALALAVALVHVWWVLTADTRFEEAAVAASERRARQIEAMRMRRGGAGALESKSAARTLQLSSTGHPVIAIIWKNTLALMRVVQLNQLIMPVIMAFVISAAAMKTVPDVPQAVAVAALFLAATLALLGAMTVRNDLRSDMLHLAFLKTIPLSGRQLVLGQILSGAVPLAAVQFVLILVAFVGFAVSPHVVAAPLAFRVGFLIASPLVLIAFNAAVFALLNATAVMFPAWIRLGPGGGGGIELMGQAMLMALGVFLSVGLLLVLPIVAIVTSAMLLPDAGTAGVAVRLAAGATILCAETYGLVAWLGRAFERAEPLVAAE